MMGTESGCATMLCSHYTGQADVLNEIIALIYGLLNEHHTFCNEEISNEKKEDGLEGLLLCYCLNTLT